MLLVAAWAGAATTKGSTPAAMSAPTRRVQPANPDPWVISAAVPREDLRLDVDVVVRQLVEELGTQAGRLHDALRLAVLVEPHGLVEEEDVLERDDVTFHPLHLCHVRDAPGAVAQACLVHDHVDRRGDLFADGLDGQIH